MVGFPFLFSQLFKFFPDREIHLSDYSVKPTEYDVNKPGYLLDSRHREGYNNFGASEGDMASITRVSMPMHKCVLGIEGSDGVFLILLRRHSLVLIHVFPLLRLAFFEVFHRHGNSLLPGLIRFGAVNPHTIFLLLRRTELFEIGFAAGILI